MAASEDSQNDRGQLNARIANCEERLDSIEGVAARDHDEIIKLRAEFTEAQRARERGESKMWQVVMMALSAAMSAGTAILMAFKK